jgi:hypothetical protein
MPNALDDGAVWRRGGFHRGFQPRDRSNTVKLAIGRRTTPIYAGRRAGMAGCLREQGRTNSSPSTLPGLTALPRQIETLTDGPSCHFPSSKYSLDKWPKLYSNSTAIQDFV